MTETPDQLLKRAGEMLAELGRILARQQGQLLKDAARDATKLASEIARQQRGGGNATTPTG